MPKGCPITDDEKIRILEMAEEGCSSSEIGKKLGIHPNTVSRIKKDFYGKDVRSMDVTIAGDKKHGTLRAVGPNHYIGTCFVENGKSLSKRFNVSTGSKDAIKQWSEWQNSCWKKAEAREASQRKDIPVNKIETTADEPAKSEIKTATYEPAKSELKPKTPTSSVYILAVGDPKIAGWFVDMEQAIKAEEMANKALECAGVDARYQVLEVKQWQ